MNACFGRTLAVPERRWKAAILPNPAFDAFQRDSWITRVLAAKASDSARVRERRPVMKRLSVVVVLAAIIVIAVAVIRWLDTGCAPGNCGKVAPRCWRRERRAHSLAALQCDQPFDALRAHASDD